MFEEVFRPVVDMDTTSLLDIAALQISSNGSCSPSISSLKNVLRDDWPSTGAGPGRGFELYTTDASDPVIRD